MNICDFLAPPIITNRPQQFTRSKPGETVSFNCSYQGDPEPTVTWRKDGAAIKDEGRFSIMTKKGYTELKIVKLQYVDAGTYQIGLANSFGNAWDGAILDMNCEYLGRLAFLDYSGASGSQCQILRKVVTQKLPKNSCSTRVN